MNEAKHLIVLVHGVCANRFVMWPLAQRHAQLIALFHKGEQACGQFS